MNYKKFAYIYDLLMKDAPYSEWISLTKDIINKYHLNPNYILDLGCGTGNISIPLYESGYDVMGVDLSEDMLAIAYNKMNDKAISFPLIHQDMREMKASVPTDLIISYCDSLNYLEGKAEIEQTFHQVYHNLNEGGFFIFDMHTPYKFINEFSENTYAWHDEGVSIIWIPYVDEDQLVVEHDLTFFVKEDNGLYSKVQEIHKQKTYTKATIKKLLKNAGFEVIEVFTDFQMQTIEETGERIFYIARKE